MIQLLHKLNFQVWVTLVSKLFLGCVKGNGELFLADRNYVFVFTGKN